MAKKAFSPEYETGDVLALYQSRSNDGEEKRLRELALAFRALTRMEHEVVIPPEYVTTSKQVRTPFVRDAWHRITSSLVKKPPVGHITPKDEKKQEYRLAASIGERFDAAMLERINKERSTDLVYKLTSQLVRDGESVLKVVHRPDAWGAYPSRGKLTSDEYNEQTDDYKRGADLPIAWCDVDRLCCVPEGGQYGDEWMIEYGEFATPFLKTKYGMVEKDGKLYHPERLFEGKEYPEGLNPTATGRTVRVEFFTKREWHCIIDGTQAPGWPKPNPYAPYLPYFRAPALDSESLLYSLLFLVPRLDELLTMKLNWSAIGAYPTPVIETVPSNDAMLGLDGPIGDAGDPSGAAGQKRLTWRPGMVMDLPVGKKLSFLVPPPVGKDLNDLVVIFKSLVDVAGIPAVMRGVGGASGYDTNQMTHSAQMAYQIAAISSQRQLEKAFEFSHWLIANKVRQTVYVMGWTERNSKTGKATRDSTKEWLGLDPKKQSANIADISKLGPVSFAYRPTLPTDEQARAMIALQLTNAQKPLFDVRHALEEYMQEEDPDSIIEAMALERALQDPVLDGQVMAEALKQAGVTPPAPPPPNPAAALVGPDGMTPLLPPGPSQLQPVPYANQMVEGGASVPGLTMPLVPPSQGVPGNTGGREAGMFPGSPGGPNR